MPTTWPVGRWTDDTQLTLAMAAAVSRGGGRLSTPTLHSEHLRQFYICEEGWGNATRRAIYELMNMPRSARRDDAIFCCAPCDETSNIGNGALMKMAPLTLFHHFSSCPRDVRLRRVAAITNMTHNHAMARCVSIVHHELTIEWVLQSGACGNPSVSKAAALVATVEEILQKDALVVELTDGTGDVAAKLLSAFRKICDLEGQEFSSNKKNNNNNNNNNNSLPNSDDDDHIIKRVYEVSEGATSYCLSSLIAVWGVMVIPPPACGRVVAAAHMGGDTDSNASIVAGLEAMVRWRQKGTGAAVAGRCYSSQMNKLHNAEIELLPAADELAAGLLQARRLWRFGVLKMMLLHVSVVVFGGVALC
eukprot:PhM_4_TR1456/c0_g1_i1/m.8871